MKKKISATLVYAFFSLLFACNCGPGSAPGNTTCRTNLDCNGEICFPDGICRRSLGRQCKGDVLYEPTDDGTSLKRVRSCLPGYCEAGACKCREGEKKPWTSAQDEPGFIECKSDTINGGELRWEPATCPERNIFDASRQQCILGNSDCDNPGQTECDGSRQYVLVCAEDRNNPGRFTVQRKQDCFLDGMLKCKNGYCINFCEGRNQPIVDGKLVQRVGQPCRTCGGIICENSNPVCDRRVCGGNGASCSDKKDCTSGVCVNNTCAPCSNTSECGIGYCNSQGYCVSD